MSLLRRFQSRVQFPLIRIDDRLIHGQVILGWAEPLRIRPLILAHDGIAQDQDLKKAIMATVPAHFDFSIKSISDSVSIINNSPSSQHLMVVAESPAAVLALWEHGAVLKSFNIGGLHFKEDRIKLLPYVSMSRREINQIGDLVRSGIKVCCQDLPSTLPVSWAKLTEKLDIE